MVENKSDMPDVHRRVRREKNWPMSTALLFAATSAQGNVGVEKVFVEFSYGDPRESSDVSEKGQTEKVLPFTFVSHKILWNLVFLLGPLFAI